MARTVMTAGYAQRIEREARPTINRIAKEVAEIVKANVPVKTGKLKRSVRAKGNRVYIGTDHWHYIEYGTRPHVIEVRGRIIKHPGSPEFAPMRGALGFRPHHFSDTFRSGPSSGTFIPFR